jgi:hypothetical protein
LEGGWPTTPFLLFKSIYIVLFLLLKLNSIKNI